jgi:hypothetical protein
MDSFILNLKVQILHKIVSSLENLNAKISGYLFHKLNYYFSIATTADSGYDLRVSQRKSENSLIKINK